MIDVEDTEPGGHEPPQAGQLELLRTESREVLNHQIALVRSIDEKAMWVVRTAVVATSVVVTGAGIAGESFLVRNWAATTFAALGVVVLLLVSVWGSVLFAVARPPFGPSPALTDQLSRPAIDGETTRRILLQGYSEWIGEATEEVDNSARAFTALQIGFVAAVYSLALSGVVLAVSSTGAVGQVSLGAAALVGTLGVLLSLVAANTEGKL